MRHPVDSVDIQRVLRQFFVPILYMIYYLYILTCARFLCGLMRDQLQGGYRPKDVWPGVADPDPGPVVWVVIGSVSVFRKRLETNPYFQKGRTRNRIFNRGRMRIRSEYSG